MPQIHYYAVRVEPHLTDYAGVVWHGSYLRWLEEARIDALRQSGIEYANLVGLGCDLPVLRLEISYCRSLRMGDLAVVRSRITRRDRVRVIWEQNIYRRQEMDRSMDDQLGDVAVKSQVTIVPVDMKKQQIMRHLPPELEEIFLRITA